MKTEEDEAFDDLAKRQGDWGGGFKAKRKMAADKLWDKPSFAFDEWWNGDNDESTNPFRLESGAYWAWAGWKAALAQPVQEPVKIAHRHEWFRTGEMKVGQMRCISCGAWGQEEITQRTWVGLTDEEREEIALEVPMDAVCITEAKLKEKNI